MKLKKVNSIGNISIYFELNIPCENIVIKPNTKLIVIIDLVFYQNLQEYLKLLFYILK